MNKLVVVVAFALVGCLGSAPVEEHAPSPPKSDSPAADVDMGPAAAVGPDLATDDAGVCGGQQFAVQRIAPNVMLVIDRSGSMGDPIATGSATTKWTDLKNAVGSLVTGYDAEMRLGAAIFSSDGNCAASNIDVPLASMAGQTVEQKLAAQGPNGNTPTAFALDTVIAKGMVNDPTRGNYVILATDGEPNCTDVDVTSRITKLYNATPSVKTYVIGIGDGTASNPTLLNQWAVAGHTARTGATQYYQTNSPADLKAAFDAIVGGLASCDFKMMQTAPDPNLVRVTENGTLLSPSPTNGYTFDPSTSTVSLHGTACDTLRANPSTSVSVTYGCPAPPPIQ